MQVIFRTHKKTSEVFALFPYEIDDAQLNITYFSISEGHSSCDYHKMMRKSKPVSIENETVGRIIRYYNSCAEPIELEIITQRSQSKFLKAVTAFKAKYK